MQKANATSFKKIIKAPGALNSPSDYDKPVSFSRRIKLNIKKGSFLFISGTASIDNKGRTLYPNNIEAQTRRRFKNLTALLKSEGSPWHEVIKTTCYLKRMRDYDTFNEYRNQFYRQQKLEFFPASTCVEANLCRPDLLVEIELIAFQKAR